MKKIFVTMLFFWALTGCLSVPITSVPKLLALKPETMDISGMEVAVRVQDDFVIDEDGVILRFVAPISNSDETLKKTISLTPIEAALTPYLQKQTRRGFQIKRFRVNPDDVPLFVDYRNQVLEERALGIGNKKGSFFAAAKGCLKQSANPFVDIKMTLYLKTDKEKKYFKLFREQKLAITRKRDDSQQGGNQNSEKQQGAIQYCDERKPETQ